ncbi:MAG: peptidoglycan binding domain-containing protein, partial [Chloroflexota bacterium]
MSQKTAQTRRPIRTVSQPPAAPIAPIAPSARRAARPIPARLMPARRAKRKQPDLLLIAMIAAPLMFIAVVGLIVAIGAVFILGGSTALPGVSAAGVKLGGLSAQAAAEKLQSGWSLTLSDGTRTIPVDPAALGITLDAQATAEQAVTYGRGHGDLLRAVLGNVDIPPVIQIDLDATQQGLLALRDQIEQAPSNAGITLVNGVVQPRPAVAGKALDLDATLAPLRQNAAAALADGVLELAMTPIQPQLTDSSALVQAAGALLVNPLQIQLYDPVSNQSVNWSVAPQTWSTWLVAGATGLSFDAAPVQAYLNQQQSQLPAGDYLDGDESLTALQTSIAQSSTNSRLRIYHHDSQHIVQSGETLIGIAWNLGIPYPWIQQANPGVDALSVGQSITIPSQDKLLPLPIIWDKRIVVSISQQRVRVYENGAIKWDWVASTGIDSSPTWTGVYQILLHDPNAYAGNWNLWMPNFL